MAVSIRAGSVRYEISPCQKPASQEPVAAVRNDRLVLRPAYAGRVIEMSRADFEVLVSDALDQVPPELAALIDNVAVFVEDDAPDSDPHLLGIYEGIPLTERGNYYGGVLPDRITVYRNPTLEICDTVEDVVDEVNITVVHEIAHHFGIDDARLHDLGYG